MQHLPKQQEMIGEQELDGTVKGAYYCLFGQPATNTWAELFQFESLFNRFHFNQIVELESGTGTTTLFLAIQAWYKRAKTYTFATKPIPSPTLELLERLYDVLWYAGDIFEKEMEERITARIQRSGRTVLYCNNADKQRAIETWTPKLKKDDLLVIYGRGKEITNEKIDEYCKEYKMNVIENKEWWDGFASKQIGLIKS